MKKIIIILGGFSGLCAQKAFISVPVADLMSSPLASHALYQSFTQPYQHIPLCATNLYTSTVCPRLHQVLFNEVVDVLETTTQEAKIEISSAFYVTTQGKQVTTYWTDKKNLTYFSELEQNHISPAIIPPPVSYEQIHTSAYTIIALTKPVFNKRVNTTFSVGTRFVLACPAKNNLLHYKVCFYNPAHKQVEIITIPKSACLIPAHTDAEQRTHFVRLVRHWAHTHHGYIPYTWGGTSFTTVANEPFSVGHHQHDQQETYYQVADYLANQTCTGFDCAGIVLRAAQTVGIPYCYKNTHTLAQYLPALQPTDILQEGDLLWIPGHVMIVSNIPHNRLIEARFYKHGYGKLHEIELHKVFDNITTYQDLVTAVRNHQPLHRLDTHGNKKETFKTAKLLKLVS